MISRSMDERWLEPGQPVLARERLVAIVLIAAATFVLLGVGSYLLSLRIAADRATVARLDHVADAREADVRRLRQDYEIRSRLPELDRWSRRLNLSAPEVDQYAIDSGTLVTAADARQQQLRVADDAARKAEFARHPSYPATARAQLDTLIGAAIGG